MSINEESIFVVGFPRSGTTLLQSLICTQNIVSFPETHYFRLLKQYSSLDSIDKIDAFKKDIKSFTGISLSNIDNEDILNKKVNEKEIFEFLITQLAGEDQLEQRWLEKTPAHIHSFKDIKNIYPNSKFVFIVRSPLDAIISCKKNIHSNISLRKLATRWKHELNLAEELNNKYPNDLKIVRYEDLVQNTNHTIKDICNFLDLDFDKEKVNDFSNLSHKYIMPFEKWKDNNKNKIAYKKNKSKSEFSLKESLQLQYYLIKQIREYKFDIMNPFLFKCYLIFKKIK